MKKDELVKRVESRGIKLGETQTQLASELAEEELANVAGGNNISVAPKKGKSTVKTGEKNALSDDTEIEVASDPC